MSFDRSRYPIELDTDRPLRGWDATGSSIVFDDFLSEGMRVGPQIGDDVFPDATVVRHKDGTLWIEADDPTPRAKRDTEAGR